jgi:hypothetical protein
MPRKPTQQEKITFRIAPSASRLICDPIISPFAQKAAIRHEIAMKMRACECGFAEIGRALGVTTSRAQQIYTRAHAQCTGSAEQNRMLAEEKRRASIARIDRLFPDLALRLRELGYG